MTHGFDPLLASLDRLWRSGRSPNDLRLQRELLDLLLASSDPDAAAALARHPDRLLALLSAVPRFWLSYLDGRHVGWVSDALGLLLADGVPGPGEPVPAAVAALFDALALWPRHDRSLPVYERALAPGPLRLAAADRLLRYATLPVDLLEVVARCLDEGVRPDACLSLLRERPEPALRRRLFDRLWPIAQADQGLLPWADVTPDTFFAALVQTAPAPDLLAILLDTLTGRAFSHALVKAIGEHPDPHLVPALERWAQAHPERVVRQLAVPALAACHRARA